MVWPHGRRPAQYPDRLGGHFLFSDFLVHALPIVVVCWFVALLMLYWLFREDLHAASTIDSSAVMQLNPSEALKHKDTAIKVLIVIGLAVVFFLWRAGFTCDRLSLRFRLPPWVCFGCTPNIARR